jgi:hypothetical protein
LVGSPPSITFPPMIPMIAIASPSMVAISIRRSSGQIPSSGAGSQRFSQ